jgi:8-oxo-dGTP diphosphatase
VSEDRKTHPKPGLTADVVVVAAGEGRPRVLFIQRKRDPFRGAWALPGGFVEPTETVAEAAARELNEETGLDGVAVEELGCFSKPGRDPRGWVVTIAHLAVIPAERAKRAKAGDDASETAWLELTSPPGGGFTLSHDGEPVEQLAFDHRDIVAAAVKRLRDRGIVG